MVGDAHRGYALPGQLAGGIHQRLFARAFIFADGADGKRFCYVSCDIGMGSDIINQKGGRLFVVTRPHSPLCLLQ